MNLETRPAGRLLAIDMGTKTLGLALYSPEADLVSPLHTIRRAKWADDLKALKAVIDEYDVQAFVIGYPLESDGKEGVRCQSVRAFERNLRAAFSMKTMFQDERYSTQAAENALLDLDSSRETRRAVGDAVAAQVILESYIEATA